MSRASVKIDWQARPATDDPGDSGRVASLFTAHNEALLRFLTCRLRSAQEAREVAQDAYVRLLQLDATDSVDHPRAYLFRTAANLATDRLRSSARRERADQLESSARAAAFEPSPETSVAAQQEIANILLLLDELPSRCRYAFVMHRFYGHSIAEVAQAMALSVRMVQIYVERALAFCRNQLPG